MAALFASTFMRLSPQQKHTLPKSNLRAMPLYKQQSGVDDKSGNQSNLLTFSYI